MSKPTTPSSSRARGLGASLGGAFESLARRVSNVVAEVSETVAVPEPIRTALERARTARATGAFDDAQRELERAGAEHGEHKALAHGLALTTLQQVWFVPSNAASTLPEPASDDPLGRAIAQLGRSAASLAARDAQAALDALRRAGRELERIADADRDEVAFLLHAGRARAYGQTGARERELRELRKAQARLVPTNAPAYAWLVATATASFLALDRADAANEWLHALRARRRVGTAPEETRNESESANAPASPDATLSSDLLVCEREAFLRLAAARDDRATVDALLAEPGFVPDTALRLALALANRSRDALALATRLRDAAPDDPVHRRRWALARLHHDAALSSADGHEITAALVDYGRAQPAANRLACAQELAHVALALDHWSASVREVIAAAASSTTRPPRELTVYLARAKASDEHDDSPPASQSTDLDGDALALAIETDELAGPDEHSPLRDVTTRFRVLAGQIHLLAAQRAIREGADAKARSALVDALSEDPDLLPAQRMLGELARPQAVDDLETALNVATELLTGVALEATSGPSDAVATASRQIIRARERLARPLTIAVMGEFSAGKSTFVNALLGASVAPMGVLPTTSTINVFRPGQHGGAYVHRRDGELRHVAAADITTFLAGIDEVEAKTIRYIELERREGSLGEVIVVDTPGLNALDPYHERVAREFLDQADAVIWVFAATRGATASEAEVIDELHASGRRLLGVLNKIDTVDEAERDAVVAYVRERLGDRLEALVPASADAALRWRESDTPRGDDPLMAVTTELEQTFFARARQLKRALTAKQLDDALALAIEQVDGAARALEAIAAGAQDDDDRRLTVRSTLVAVSDALLAGTEPLAEALTRELLSLGLLGVDDGWRRDLDEQDLDYLASVFDDGVMAMVGEALAAAGSATSRLAVTRAVQSVVLLRFTPWLRGQLMGLSTRGFLAEIITASGDQIRHGESALRRAIVDRLRPIATSWRERIVGLRRTVELTLSRSHSREVRAPRARALRLRATVLAPLRALRDSPTWREPTR